MGNLTSYVTAFVDELAQQGVTNIVISPGSRSTPLAYAFCEHPNMRVYRQIDERSAGFFALGMAKRTNRPAVLLCTSGTAAANYYPAIVEAKLSRVPLIVLTADRPHELRSVGAPQTIDQLHLYGPHAKQFIDMPLPEVAPLSFVRQTIRRAVRESIAPVAGVVHLNVPFREPLIPDMPIVDWSIGRLAGAVVAAERTVSLDELRPWSERLRSVQRGVIICGDTIETVRDEVIQFALQMQWPIIADPLSNVRFGTSVAHVIDSYDAFLRNERACEALQPQLIIRFGAMPVSKALTMYVKQTGAEQWIVDETGEYRDPTHTVTHYLAYPERAWLKGMTDLVHREDGAWLAKWSTLNTIAKQYVIAQTPAGTEGEVFATLHEAIVEDSTVFISNSMPIRDSDTYFTTTTEPRYVMANRGANGIDGIVSSALGAAAVSEQRTYLIIGDLAFTHDLNGLLAATMNGIRLTVIVINNDGGGIFSFLPQAQHEAHFETLFGTPLAVDFAGVAPLYQCAYTRCATMDELRIALNEEREQYVHVIEVKTNRQQNAAAHREMWRTISGEISTWFNNDN